MSDFRICKQVKFCYGHRLLDYGGKCANLHGHTAAVDLEVEGPLDELGMVCDFGTIKQRIGGMIDERLDHRTLLHQDDPLVPLLQQVDRPPFTMPCNPTAENIAALILGFATDLAIPITRVRMWESESSFAEAAKRLDAAPVELSVS